MRRTSWFVQLVVLTIAFSAFAVPALEAAREPTGDRISLFDGDQTFPADTAFHVRHGFLSVLGEDMALGRAVFRLDVDGVELAPSYVETALNDGLHSRLWFFNFSRVA